MKKLFSFVCALVCAMSLSAQQTSYYIAGDSETLFGGKWNSKGVALEQQTDGTWLKTFTTCEFNTPYQFKVTDGTWDNSWGYGALESIPDGVTNSDGNIKCTTYDATMTVVFNPTTNKITLTGVFVNSGDPIPTTYYMKHNWYGAGWSWKKLTDNGNGTYSIRERYGASGCNWHTSASDDGSNWVQSPTLVDNPKEGDSAVFTLNPTAEKPITITKIQGAEVVINYVDITIRVMAGAAPTIWWWGAGSKCPDAEKTTNAEGVTYSWDNQPVMTAVDGKTGWYEWVLKDVNEENGVSFKINSGNTIVAKESTCYDVNGTVIDCNSTDPDVPTLPKVSLRGEMNNWDGDLFIAAADAITASVSVSLDANTTYKFKILEGDDWYGCEGTMTSTKHENWIFAKNTPDCKIETTYGGSYKFIWKYADKTLTVVYPSTPSALSNTEVENAVVKVIRNGQVLIVREGVTYNMMGQVIQ